MMHFLGLGKPSLSLPATPPFLAAAFLPSPSFWPTGLLQETFEELAVLVEVFDRVGMVGAWAIHELVEVVRQALLGLLAHAISCGDQRGVVESAPILFVLLAPLCGGALILVCVLGLAFVPASIEDRSDRLLTGGMVSGDVEQVTGDTGLQASKLLD